MLDIYRGASIIASVNIAEDTIYNGQVNAEDRVKASFVTTSFLGISLGDHIFLNGKKYMINNLIDFEIDHLFRYDIIFESEGQYDLLSASFLKSSVFGTVTEIVTVIVDAMNEKDSGWTVGDVDDSGVKIKMDFYGDSCRSALTKTLDKFGLELNIIIKEINLKKKLETDSGLITFEYGMGNGLYSMKRKTSGEFFTRAYGLGSERNIPAGYEGVDGRLTFDPGFVDKGVSEWGVFDKTIIFEEIYPQRTGTLTGVDVDLITLSDSTIDFNLADNFITGQVPKIVMQTGDLAGEEFEIIQTSYDNGTKTFQIKPSYEGAYQFPNIDVNIKVGDEYVFIGINLPQSYIDDAEDRLEAATNDYINANGGILEISFDLDIDEKWIRDNSLEGVLQLGTKVKVVNTAAGIDADLRITSISYPILYPSRITCTVADKLPPDNIMEMQKIIVNNDSKTTIIEKKNEQLKTFTSIRLDELDSKVFDPLGNYYSSKIAPLSIETAQLQVGTRSQIFALSVAIKASTSNIALFEWEAGVLDHYTVAPNAITSWNISSGSISGLVDTQSYYIYARCNKANTTGVLVLDTVQRPVATDSTYYYFLVGLLSSRILDRNGYYVRRASLSYGSTDVNGAFITTGAIISQDGLTQLNLDAGVYSGRIQFLLEDEATYKNINTLNNQAITALADATDAKSKTDLLKDLAFEDLVEVAMLGSTVVVGGYIKTDLIDVDFIRANVLQAEYIAALDVDFVRGTIGGITINEESISATNFSITSDGIITAVGVVITGQVNSVTGTIGGNTINPDRIVGDKWSVIDGVLTAKEASFENIDVDGITAVNATVTGLIRTSESGQRIILDSSDNSLKFYSSSSLQAEINMAVFGGSSGFIAYGASGSTSFVTGEAIGISNTAYGGVAFRNDGQNIITGVSLNIDVSLITLGSLSQNSFTGTRGGFNYINGIMVA